ncbi:MAG: hypothetical protein L0H83_15550, partial [Salinisphaera sp.]|nr:hypothetical protein [Salinisphaera sp.]
MKTKMRVALCAAMTAAGLLAASAVQARDDGPGFFQAVFGTPDFGFYQGGFVRNELAISLTSATNPWNEDGNLFNGKRVMRTSAVTSDFVVRNTETKDDDINLEYLRGELQFTMKLTSNLRFKGTLRALLDPDVYPDYDPEDVPLANPVGTLQQEDPNLFEYRYDSCAALLPLEEPGGGDGTPFNNPAAEAAQRSCIQANQGSGWLELAGDQYMVDFPRFYFDYQKGGLLLRLGVQQIAWGDMLFFRVLDVPNGLDLRRHSALDFAPEEFSDKRIPSFGLRASYTLPVDMPVLHGWSVDAYVQRFRPTIYSNPNTPYNVIAAQFTVRDQFEQYDDEYNYGVRFKGSAGPLELQLVINRRYNHFGVFQWTDADVAQGLQPFGPTALSGPDITLAQARGIVDAVFFAPAGGTIPAFTPQGFEVPGTGARLADSAFEVDPTGPVSGEEFATYGALARLDHFRGVNAAADPNVFVGAAALGAVQVGSAFAQKRQEDLFHQLSGGLRGHITRDYFRENNYGIGVGWTVAGWNLDIEAKYT